MRLRSRAATLAAAAVVGGLLTPLTSAAAAPVPDAAVVPLAAAAPDTAAAAPVPDAATAPSVAADTLGLAPGMFEALRRDLGLSTEQVRTRLAMEAAAPVTERRLRAELGTVFAGAWLPARGGPLVVAVTDPAAADAVRAAGAVPAMAARTERQLDATKAALDAVRADKDVHSWHVDVTTNTVVVSTGSAAAAERFVASAGVDRAAVRVVPSTGAPRTLYDIRGGDQYLINGNTLCSIGFSVAGGFVTAGHCGGAGSGTAGYNNVAQGTVRGSSFPGNDYGWVQTNGSWTPQPWVNNYAGGNATVAGSQEAAIGSSVCRSGRTTGWRCAPSSARTRR